MERADLLYSGLMFAAGMLSLWTALLVTATLIALAPSPRKSASSAATISSTGLHTALPSSVRRSVDGSVQHGAQETALPRSVSQTISQRSVLGRAVRLT